MGLTILQRYHCPLLGGDVEAPKHPHHRNHKAAFGDVIPWTDTPPSPKCEVVTLRDIFSVDALLSLRMKSLTVSSSLPSSSP